MNSIGKSKNYQKSNWWEEVNLNLRGKAKEERKGLIRKNLMGRFCFE